MPAGIFVGSVKALSVLPRNRLAWIGRPRSGLKDRIEQKLGLSAH